MREKKIKFPLVIKANFVYILSPYERASAGVPLMIHSISTTKDHQYTFCSPSAAVCSSQNMNNGMITFVVFSNFTLPKRLAYYCVSPSLESKMVFVGFLKAGFTCNFFLFFIFFIFWHLSPIFYLLFLNFFPSFFSSFCKNDTPIKDSIKEVYKSTPIYIKISSVHD